MTCRVVVASLALTWVAAHEVRADDRYLPADPSFLAPKHSVVPRRAAKPRTFRAAHVSRRAADRRSAARRSLKHARIARSAPRIARRAVPRVAHPAVPRPRPMQAGPLASRPVLAQPRAVSPPVRAQILPLPWPLPIPLPPPEPAARPVVHDPEQLAFERTWNRIAERVNPERALAPAVEAAGLFVASADGATRALVERTVVGLARRFLVETATIGGTMLRQTPEVAIGRLHPVFARRLAAATREARAAGLPNAGCFSAYREPGLRVGGFRDKHASLHAYGLACDMAGIGPPGSDSARLWHEIARRHGLYNPYEFRTRSKRQLVHMPAWRHPWEWNHYQPTGIRAILRHDALRRTITAHGPIDLEEMWEVGSRLIDKPVRGVGRVLALGKFKKKVRRAALKRGKVGKARAAVRPAARRPEPQRQSRQIVRPTRWAALAVRTRQARSPP